MVNNRVLIWSWDKIDAFGHLVDQDILTICLQHHIHDHHINSIFA